MPATAQRLDPAPGTAAVAAKPPARRMKAVSGYRLPGEGSSSRISTITVVSLLALWWIASSDTTVMVEMRELEPSPGRR